MPDGSQLDLPLDLFPHDAPGDIERLGPAVIRVGHRPDGSEALVREEAALSVFPDVMRCLEGADSKKILDDLMSVVSERDAFAVWSKLCVQYGWSPWIRRGSAVDLFEAIETIPARLNDARYRLVAVWVRETGYMPPFTIGSPVSVDVRVCGELRRVSGVVRRINWIYGRCNVSCPSLGHSENQGFTLDWERVLPLPVQ